ncbi:MAG: 2-oxoacid:ferredoxin oxidoreductase subunit beta, partial [Planctomycetota bacterium]
VGTVKKSTPMGSIDRPVNPISLALAAEAGFVARTVDVFGPHLQETLLRAAAHEGSVFVEVLQNCLIFNDATFSNVTDRASREDNVLYLEHQKPLLFGAGGDKGIRLNGLKPEVVRVGEGGVPESELLVHDEKDESLAYLLSRMEGDGFPTPIGTFRTQEHVSYEAAAAQQVRTAREQKGEGDLMKLIHSGDVWTVP